MFFRRGGNADESRAGRPRYGGRKTERAPARGREIVLLLVDGDEIVKVEFHHCHVQQVGGFDRDRMTVLPGKLQGCVEHLLVIHFESGRDSVCQVLFQQRQPGLKLGGYSGNLVAGLGWEGRERAFRVGKEEENQDAGCWSRTQAESGSAVGSGAWLGHKRSSVQIGLASESLFPVWGLSDGLKLSQQCHLEKPNCPNLSLLQNARPTLYARLWPNG